MIYIYAIIEKWYSSVEVIETHEDETLAKTKLKLLEEKQPKTCYIIEKVPFYPIKK